MSSKEAFPIRKAAELERTLLAGDLPWLSVNDHRSLAFIFDGPARRSTVSTASNERLNRWATYLRCCGFDTLHIPGHINHFCDLLSRQGCHAAPRRWLQRKTHPPPAPARAIITPTPVSTNAAPSSKDLDLNAEDLLPNVLNTEWPGPEAIRRAQEQSQIKTDHQKEVAGHALCTDVAGKIALPPNHPTTRFIIGLCHAGDLRHNPLTDTVREFRRHYYLHGLKRSQEEKHIRPVSYTHLTLPTICSV